jgi:hypothetical protein
MKTTKATKQTKADLQRSFERTLIDLGIDIAGIARNILFSRRLAQRYPTMERYSGEHHGLSTAMMMLRGTLRRMTPEARRVVIDAARSSLQLSRGFATRRANELKEAA